ncbi:hypothetical protein [Spirosoma sp. KNUC1025]|uniref:hypothetical protein n=1 Tax=Spirosoma sp. KNUC1025 TaxID=2894082 RepID=UPI0038634583
MLPFLSTADRQFIRDHLSDDVRSLLLRSNPAGLDLKKLAAQIGARQKSREKLPTWYASDNLIFPLLYRLNKPRRSGQLTIKHL